MIPEQKTGFRFAGMVSLWIPSLFLFNYKIPPPYGHMTTGTGTIEGILPAVVTTLPQAGYAYIIAQSALFQKRSWFYYGIFIFDA